MYWARAADDPDATAYVLTIGSKEDFLPLLQPLSEAGFRAVAVDGRGQHESPGPADEEAYAQHELPAEVADFLHRRWLNTVPEQLTTTGRQLVTEPDRVAELAAVPLPKLVLSGSDDYAWPVPWQNTMATRLAADRTIIEGADHSPNVERPAETARALIAFWQKISARRRTPGTPSRLPA
nr:alpha/beta hydrolase [Streptomyces dysideae]